MDKKMYRYFPKMLLSSEFYCYLFLSFFTTMLAWYFTGVYKYGLGIPIVYSGDGLGYLWTIKRILNDIWFSATDANGYPFTTSLSEHPGSDGGSFLVLHLLDFYFSDLVKVRND